MRGLTIKNRLGRILRRSVRVYATWRGPLIIVVGAGSVAAAGLGADSGLNAILSMSVMFAAWLALSVLIALEIARQDRLRKRSLRAESSYAVTGAPRSPKAGGANSAVRLGRSAVQQGRVAASSAAPRADLVWRQAPLISVIVTAHNEQPYIAEALRSVQAQSWTRFECIVIDDASTDDTLDTALQMVADDSRFRLIHLEANVGLSRARNTGLSEASGEFVCFLDGDDFLYSRALESRLEVLKGTSDPHWVVGAYCRWHSVPENRTYEIEAPHDLRSFKRRRVTWFDALFDTPFIASAPLLRTEVAVGIGGFNAGLNSAEDFDFWSRMLRHGYVFDPVDYTGVAYRQRIGSMFRATAVSHATNTVATYEMANRSMAAAEFATGAPHPYIQPAHKYQSDIAKFRRYLTSYVSAVARSDERSIEHLSNVIVEDYAPFMARVVNLEGHVRSVATRFLRHDESALSARRVSLERDVWDSLGPDLGIHPATREPFSGDPPSTTGGLLKTSAIASPDCRTEISRPRMSRSELVQRVEERCVFLVPEASYHVYEAGPLARELAKRGHSPVFLLSARHVERVSTELHKYSFPVVVFDPKNPELSHLLESASAFVAFNDWGDASSLITSANEVGIPTFAKVEGVQDFDDVDTGRERFPYRTASHVLFQGKNDRSALRRKGSIVGSTRLERIWRAPPARRETNLAVINVNFTYNVLEEYRDYWVDTAVDACKSAGMNYVLSMHPAERGEIADPHVSVQPMRHLLTRATLLVSRFSTVPFEAMARGVPFVYHNPHGEAVPTFAEPDGAFWTSVDSDALAEAIGEARDCENYRSKCEEFFLRQVDVGEQSSESRGADAVGLMVREGARLGGAMVG